MEHRGITLAFYVERAALCEKKKAEANNLEEIKKIG